MRQSLQQPAVGSSTSHYQQNQALFSPLKGMDTTTSPPQSRAAPPSHHATTETETVELDEDTSSRRSSPRAR